MRCLNCHTEYEGHYCPECGQSAKTSRFTVKSALSNTLDVWGMGSRSLPRTIWHLLIRPGQMIGDYLDGKRMPYFPPVKMLFVLCVFYALITSFGHLLTGEPAGGNHMEETTQIAEALSERGKDKPLFDFGIGKVSVEGAAQGLTQTLDWFYGHKPVTLLCLHLLVTLATWCVFRRAPKRPHTTLAENFFIQVLISSQLMVLSLLYILVFGEQDGAFFYPLPGWLLLGLFIWDFKYLFGYSWPKTVGLTLLTHLSVLLLFILLCTLFFGLLSLALVPSAVG